VNLFDAALNERLASIREQGLYRQLRRVDSPQSPRLAIGGRTLLNFSSNDYLGLADEPSIKEAAIKVVEKFGAGSGASRLICGSLAPHHELEEALAAFKGTEAALTFSSGYNAALGRSARWRARTILLSSINWFTHPSWMRRVSAGRSCACSPIMIWMIWKGF